MVTLNLAEEVEFFLYRATIVSFVPPSVHVLSADGLLFCRVNREPFADSRCLKIFYGSRHLGLDGKAQCKSRSLLKKVWDIGISALL